MMVGSNPRVIEFNARWGDPEAQVILPGLKNDLFMENQEWLSPAYHGDTQVIMTLSKASEFLGLIRQEKLKGKYYASGERLFYIVGEGGNVIEARQRAYEAMAMVSVEGNNLHFRTDIGWRDVEYTHANDS